MSKISILPQHIANQIAAGEVVERPASVAKELIENSIDAASTQITIAIKNGGMDMISVTDNGHGMDFDDARLAFERHATSKITDAHDLEAIGTLGFRGEALASISSIAHVTIHTKEHGAVKGTICKNVGSKIVEHGPHGCPEGTKITIENLFFNTPARRKHVKTIATEFSHIADMVTRIALSFSSIGFKLLHNDQIVFDVPSKQSLADRIRVLIGKDFADNMLAVDAKDGTIHVHGFIAKPSMTRHSRKQQFLFVNNRPVQSAVVSKAISDAFHSLLPERRHPLFVLHVAVDPEEIDVNVHPRKMEVKFLHQQSIFRLLRRAVKQILESHNLTPDVSFGTPLRPLTGEFKKYVPPRQHIQKQPSTVMPQRLSFDQSSVPHAAERSSTMHMPELPQTKLKPVAQIAQSYIIAYDEEGITIIDQHAAHERIMYMHLMQVLDSELSGKALSQKLLLPERVDVPIAHVPILETNLELLSTLGFEIDHFGGNTYVIQAVPEKLSSLDMSEIFLGLLDNLAEKNAPKDIAIRRERVLTYLSCKSAIKFGRTLTYDEQVALIAQLEELSQKHTCPHGRPTMIRLGYHELEKKFDRS